MGFKVRIIQRIINVLNSNSCPNCKSKQVSCERKEEIFLYGLEPNQVYRL